MRSYTPALEDDDTHEQDFRSSGFVNAVKTGLHLA